MAKSINTAKSVNITEEIINKDKLMSQLIKLIEINKIPQDWKRLERYMVVNGKKIKKFFPINEKICNDAKKVKLGIILEKNNKIITFYSLSVLIDKCILNHTSIHTLDGNLKAIKINMVNELFSYNCSDNTYSHKFIEQLLNQILNEDKFQWDMIL